MAHRVFNKRLQQQARNPRFQKARIRFLDHHQPFAESQAAVARARALRAENDGVEQKVELLAARLKAALAGERRRMGELRVLVTDVESRLRALESLDSEKLRRFREKYALRLLTERWLPKSIAWRPKAMFRAPFDSFHMEGSSMPPFIEQLLSEESLRRTEFFDPRAVAHWRKTVLRMRRRSPARTAVEMGLMGVTATQLWHKTFIDSELAEVPERISDLRFQIAN